MALRNGMAFYEEIPFSRGISFAYACNRYSFLGHGNGEGIKQHHVSFQLQFQRSYEYDAQDGKENGQNDDEDHEQNESCFSSFSPNDHEIDAFHGLHEHLGQGTYGLHRSIQESRYASDRLELERCKQHVFLFHELNWLVDVIFFRYDDVFFLFGFLSLRESSRKHSKRGFGPVFL